VPCPIRATLRRHARRPTWRVAARDGVLGGGRERERAALRKGLRLSPDRAGHLLEDDIA